MIQPEHGKAAAQIESAFQPFKPLSEEDLESEI
jgi:hypothetical protein